MLRVCCLKLNMVHMSVIIIKTLRLNMSVGFVVLWEWHMHHFSCICFLHLFLYILNCWYNNIKKFRATPRYSYFYFFLVNFGFIFMLDGPLNRKPEFSGLHFSFLREFWIDVLSLSLEKLECVCAVILNYECIIKFTSES